MDITTMIDYPQPFIHCYYWGSIKLVAFYSRDYYHPLVLSKRCVAIFKIKYK